MDLRKVAVVVASLDRATADRLLDEMPEFEARRIREAMVSIESVPIDETRLAIADFLRMQTNQGGDAEDPSTAQVSVRNVPPTTPAINRTVAAQRSQERARRHPDDADASPIQRASERVIAECLQGEVPQAIAVALTDLPADRASEVVSHLPAALQAEVLERMVELTPESDVEAPEIRDEFRGWLNEQIERFLRRAELANRLATILNATHHQTRERIIHNVAASDAQLAKELELQLSENCH